MKVVNETPCPVAFVRNAEEDGSIVGLLLAAITYRIGPAGLELAAEQLPLILKPTEEMLPDDAQFFREGVSVTATGFVYPRNQGDRVAVAELAVGEETRRVVAYGARTWRRALGIKKLAPSEPAPIEEPVAMSWQNTYGGMFVEPAYVVEHEGEEMIVPEHPVGYPTNMDGMGFYLYYEHALDQPLPPLESPEDPVTAWDQRPDPFCFAPAPLSLGLRAKGMVNEQEVEFKKIGRVTGRACPALIFDEVKEGDSIRLTGMKEGGATLQLEVPPAGIAARAEVGGKPTELTLLLDAVDIDAEAATVRFVYRTFFRYDLIQNEQRRMRFFPTRSLIHFPQEGATQ